MVGTIPAILLGVLGPPAAAAHPLHTTLTTIAWHSDRRLLDVEVRVFTQDLADARIVADSATCRYAAGALSIQDVAGKPLPAARCATERAGDITWIRLHIPAVSPAGLRGLSAFLFERFPDQINIVQASLAGHARTVLFTTGDGLKPLT